MTLAPLRYGLRQAVPSRATSCWGARLIVTQDGHVDLPPDRTDRQGTTKILDRPTQELPPHQLMEILADLLRSHLMHTRIAEPFVLHQSERLTVVGDTLASAGYCYLAAWTTEPTDHTGPGERACSHR